jgi:hypothetical protein
LLGHTVILYLIFWSHDILSSMAAQRLYIPALTIGVSFPWLLLSWLKSQCRVKEEEDRGMEDIFALFLIVKCVLSFPFHYVCWLFYSFFSIFLVGLDFELRASFMLSRQLVYHLNHSTSLFFLCVCDGFFLDRVSQTICPVWLWTVVLLICASWEARITGVSWWLALAVFLFWFDFKWLH